MLKSGIPVHSALQFLADGSEGEEAKVYIRVTKGIEGGASFSQALALEPKVFPPLIVSSAQIGERTGRLDQILSEVADLLERQEQLKGKIRAALTYPGFLCVLTFVIVLGVVFFVLPKEAEMLEGLGAEMPLVTRILVSIVEWLLHPVSALLVFLLAVATVVVLKKTNILGADFRQKRDRFLLTVPLLGSAIKTAAAIRLLHGMSALLESGASLTWSLAQMKPAMENLELRERLGRSVLEISHGATPSDSFAAADLFPQVVVGLLAVAEEEGNLDLACRQAADILETDLNLTLDTLANLLEPAALCFMGLVVGFVVLSTALPTAQLLQNL